MPAIFAHYTFGAETLAQFSAPVRRIVTTHRALFDLGLQGPDFYFFDQLLVLRGKHYSAIGTRLHHGACAELLQALEGSGGRRPDSASLAYLYGLIGHFALDSTCHPAIDRWVEEMDYDHHRLETEFDRFLLARDGVTVPRRFPLGSCLSADRRAGLAIGRLYEAAGLGAARDVAALFVDMRRVKDHTSLADDRAYAAVRALLRVGGAQAIGGIFMGPKDALSDETNPRLLALFEEAKVRYARLVENYRAHVFEGAALDDYFQRDFETAPEEGEQ